MKTVGVLHYNASHWITIVGSWEHNHSIKGGSYHGMNMWKDAISILYGEDCADLNWIQPLTSLGHYELRYLSTVSLDVVNNLLEHWRKVNLQYKEDEKAKKEKALAKANKELAVEWDVTPVVIDEAADVILRPYQRVESSPFHPIVIPDNRIVTLQNDQVVVATSQRRQDMYQWASFFYQDR